MQNLEKKALPAWLSINPDGTACVRLRHPREINSVKVDRLTLRIPEVIDQILAEQKGKPGSALFEAHLLSSVAGCTTEELQRFSVPDYRRVLRGYLVVESDPDDVDASSGGDA